MTETHTKEVWKSWPTNPAYEVSNMGRVRRCQYILKPFPHSKNFTDSRRRLAVTVNIPDRGRRSFYVHKLVGDCFLPNPQGWQYVEHKDGNVHNNKASNLQWIKRPLRVVKKMTSDQRMDIINSCRKQAQVWITATTQLANLAENTLLQSQANLASEWRHALIFCLYTEGMNQTDIGRALGKDPTTVIWSLRRTRKRLDLDPGPTETRINAILGKREAMIRGGL